MCQGFIHFSGLVHYFMIAKLATSSIRLRGLLDDSQTCMCRDRVGVKTNPGYSQACKGPVVVLVVVDPVGGDRCIVNQLADI